MEYTLHIDDFDTERWHHCAAQFMDYNVYQTPAYQQVRARQDGLSLSRFIIQSERGEPVLMGQVRIKKAPLVGLRIGYIQSGPLCRKQDGIIPDADTLFALLKQAYLPDRVNVLRLAPNIFEEEDGRLTERIRTAGFEPLTHIKPYRTMLFPLDTDEEGIRKRFHSGWRRYLNKAQKADLTVRQGTEPDFINILRKLYTDLTQRKGFEGLSVDIFAKTQETLPETDKMNAVMASHHDEVLTVHTTSHLGDTALGILAASSERARAMHSAYLVWWHTLLAAKAAGMKRYDLAGIDPENNPRVYQFKQRMGAVETRHIGIFEAYANCHVKRRWRIVEKLYNRIKGK